MSGLENGRIPDSEDLQEESLVNLKVRRKYACYFEMISTDCVLLYAMTPTAVSPCVHTVTTLL